MIIAQISDMHVRVEGSLAYRRVDTATFLARCVEHILHLTPRPDLVLATGDLVDSGQRAEYARLRQLLAPLPMPVYLIPGNHDDRDALTAEFADHAYLPRGAKFLQYTIEGDGLQLIALDTLLPGETGGLVCDERLDWLAARLGEARDRPTVIFLHHPPFATGIEYMDGYGLRNAAALADVVRPHAQVEAVLAGHLHRRISMRWAGTVATTAPGTAHQVALDLRPGEPGRFTLEPPGYLLHLWRPGQGFVTHSCYVGEYPGPFPFREAAT